MPSGVSDHTFRLIVDGDAAITSVKTFRTTWNQELGAMGRPGMGGPEARLDAIQAMLDRTSIKLMGFGAAGIGAAGMATKAAVDWESAWTGVLKTVDDASDAEGNLTAAGEELQAQLREMARETIPIENAHVQLAGLAEIAGQLGIQTQNIAGFTETMAQLGVSTNLTGEEAATVLAQFANITKMDQSAFDRLGATIVHLGNNLATTERDIVNFSSRIAGAGAIAGLTEAQTMAIAGSMSSVGIQAEAGGTAVQKMLIAMTQAMSGEGGFVDNASAIGETEQKLIDLNAKLVRLEAQTGASGESLRQMYTEFIASGGAVEDFGRQLGDTKRQQLFQTVQSLDEMTASLATLKAEHGKAYDPKMLGTFAETAGMTVREFKQLWEEDAAMAFAAFVEGLGRQGDEAFKTLEKLELADQRLIRSFLSLSGNSEILYNALDMANTAWDENTALTEEAARRFGTTASQMAETKNTGTDLLITLGEELLPKVNEGLETAAEHLSAFIDMFTALPEDEQQRWVNIALAVTGATLALGAGMKVASMAIGVYRGLAGAVQAVSAAQAGGLGTMGRYAAGLAAAFVAADALAKSQTDQGLVDLFRQTDDAARGATEATELLASATEGEAAAALAAAREELLKYESISNMDLWNPTKWSQLPEDIKTSFGPSAQMLEGRIAEIRAEIATLEESLGTLPGATEEAVSGLTDLPDYASMARDAEEQVAATSLELEKLRTGGVEMGAMGLDMATIDEQMQQMLGGVPGVSPVVTMMVGDPEGATEQLQTALTGMMSEMTMVPEDLLPAGAQFSAAFGEALRTSMGEVQWSAMIGEVLADDFKSNLNSNLRPLVLPIGKQMGDWLAEGAAESSFSQMIIAAVMEQMAEAMA